MDGFRSQCKLKECRRFSAADFYSGQSMERQARWFPVKRRLIIRWYALHEISTRLLSSSLLALPIVARSLTKGSIRRERRKLAPLMEISFYTNLRVFSSFLRKFRSFLIGRNLTACRLLIFTTKGGFVLFFFYYRRPIIDSNSFLSLGSLSRGTIGWPLKNWRVEIVFVSRKIVILKKIH